MESIHFVDFWRFPLSAVLTLLFEILHVILNQDPTSWLRLTFQGSFIPRKEGLLSDEVKDRGKLSFLCVTYLKRRKCRQLSINHLTSCVLTQNELQYLYPFEKTMLDFGLARTTELYIACLFQFLLSVSPMKTLACRLHLLHQSLTVCSINSSWRDFFLVEFTWMSSFLKAIINSDKNTK